jgi:hypothetical protein
MEISSGKNVPIEWVGAVLHNVVACKPYGRFERIDAGKGKWQRAISRGVSRHALIRTHSERDQIIALRREMIRVERAVFAVKV